MEQKYDRRVFSDGELIFAEGARAGEAYLIERGRVRLHKNENGRDHVIDTIGPKQIFGEMGVISDMNRMASATAVGDVSLICCHRVELQQRVNELDKDRRDALRFLIVYCQEFIPFELMKNRPEDKETQELDGIALRLLREAKKTGAFDGLDPFLSGLYKVLIGYTERRIPPQLMESEE